VRMRRTLGGALILALCGLATTTPALAAEAPLTPLPPEALAGAGPWLARGDLLVLESGADGALRQVSLISRVEAAAPTVLEVLAHPEEFPSYIPSMVRCDVTSRQGHESLVAWELEIPFKNPSGVNRYLDERPRTIRHYPLSGSIPAGAWRFDAFPIGDQASLLVLTTYAATREISWAVSKFLDAWPTFEHGAVAATAIVLFKAVASRAVEQRTGKPAARPRYLPGRTGLLNPLLAGGSTPGVAGLAPLLARGTVALVESTPDGGLGQVSLLHRLPGSAQQARDLVANPGGYPDWIPSVTATQVTRTGEGGTEFTQWMELPMLKLRTQLRLLRQGERLLLRAVGGDLPSSTTHWDFLPEDGGKSSLLVLSHVSDPGEIAWFVRKLLQKEPRFAAGLNLATNLVLIRGLERRLAAPQPPSR